MPGKRNQEMEFRYCEIPHGERLLALYGSEWVREYGASAPYRRLHFHNLLEIGYCVSGEGIMAFGETDVEYKTGMLTIIPPNFPHYTKSREGTESGWEYLFMNLSDLLLEFYPNNPIYTKKISERISTKGQYYMADENEQIINLFRMIMEEYKNKAGSFSGEYVRGLLLALLISIARGDAETVDKPVIYQHSAGMFQISNALEYIRQNYMETIKMGVLAEACNLSETHFRRLFAEYMDTTPLEYINLVRVQEACDLMKKTRCSMEEIAARVGYTAISTFNRNFRKNIGTSPYQYKKSIENHQREHQGT